VAWVKTQTRPVKVGYIARTSAFGTGAADLSMTVLGFEQALDYETLSFGAETARVRLTPAADLPALARDLSQGHMDAAVMQEPEATQAATVRGNRMIGRIDILPPNRFEDRPGTVVAATDSVIRNKGLAVSSFLELLAVATHYANNRTRNTVTATTQWLGTSPAVESIALRNLAFSSLPDVVFADGIWNWYFALRLKHVVPESLAGFMEKKDWLGIPYDSSLVVPALDRAGARIVK
jgi:ABC-type nitrate/sulfonate/bicarbonate transport system substrate-binding protein